MSFAKTFRVTAPVAFSSHEFWSLILNETRVPVGTSPNVISYLSGGTGWSGMVAKLRQLGWICVAPTPATHASAEAGRSDRRVVEPRNTIRTVVVVDSLGDIGASSQPKEAWLAMAARMPRAVRTVQRPTFDTLPGVDHPRGVVKVLRRLSVIVLMIALAGADAAVCAGWAATPEARMACCANDVACPMHKSDPHESRAGRVLTQAQADSCCASSERPQPGPSTTSGAGAISPAVLGVAVVLPASVPILVLTDGWRTAAPMPTSPVPRHIILSVFLV
jgi:hypothetical protein